jgi:hypothetical protein
MALVVFPSNSVSRTFMGILVLHRGWTDIVGEIEESAVTVAVILTLGRGFGVIEPTLALLMKVLFELLEVGTLLVGQLNSEEPVPATAVVGTTAFELGGSETAGASNDPAVLDDEVLVRPPEGRLMDIGCVIQGRSWLGSLGTMCDMVCEHVVLVFIRPAEAGDVGNGS